MGERLSSQHDHCSHHGREALFPALSRSLHGREALFPAVFSVLTMGERLSSQQDPVLPKGEERLSAQHASLSPKINPEVYPGL